MTCKSAWICNQASLFVKNIRPAFWNKSLGNTVSILMFLCDFYMMVKENRKTMFCGKDIPLKQRNTINIILNC